MRRKTGSLVVGLDVGTTTVCVVIAEQTAKGLEVVGRGTHPSNGVNKGVVVDIDAAAAAVTKAIEEAEKMANAHVGSAFVGIANPYIKGFTSEGMLPLRNRQVTTDDLGRVIEAAESVAIPKDSEVLHVLPQEYILDNLGGIKDPLGMQGMRLEANCYIVTIQTASVANLLQCCRHCGLEVNDVILAPLASAEAVLTDEERELGVALVDLGGGTTDVLVFKDDAVRHVSSLAFGGQQVTNDIARCLHLPVARAEWLKKRHGHCLPGTVLPGDEIQVESMDDAETVLIEHRDLCEIIEARVAEILHMVRGEFERHELDRYIAGVVLTGAAGQMPGIDELAASILGRHVRIGQPRHLGGLVDVVASPAYTNAVGLVLLGARDLGLSKYAKSDAGLLGSFVGKVRSWVTRRVN